MSLQIESLCDSRRIKIEGDLVDELARLPQSLAGMYSLILQNISQIEQRGRTVAETILRWLLCTKDATSPVTIAACSASTSTEYRSLSISDILDVCSNLVVYDKALDEFRFAHLSVREFLETQSGFAPSEVNRSLAERSLHTIVCNQRSRDQFWWYAIQNWLFHYDRIEEQDRKEVFELHAKRFLFNGAEPSDVFNTWLDNVDMQAFRSPKWDFALYYRTEDFRNPIILASYFGWLEVLDHFEAIQSPDKFHGPEMKMMTVAIHFNQVSVACWLLDRSICPTDKHLKLAFGWRRSDIVQIFLNMNVLPLTMEMMTIAIRSNQTSVVRWLIDQKLDVTVKHLELAFEYRRSDIVQIFLNMNVLPVTMEIMTIAICSDQTSVVRWLIDQKLDVTVKHLQLAFEYRRSDIVQVFLNMNVLPVTMEIMTIVICSSQTSVRWLVDQKLDITDEPLELAFARRWLEMLQAYPIWPTWDDCCDCIPLSQSFFITSEHTIV